ncbi:MAG: hypothetical protein Q9195_008275 [Heterodermia aff. obscurata]
MDDRKSFALRPRPESRHRDAHASSSTIQDDRTLIKLGKKPVLKRTFGLMSVLGFSCTVLITWEGILVAPIAGGQYHWVAMLAPSSNRNLLSYITAWTTIAGWQAVTASTAYLVGTQIQGVVAMTHPEYGSKPWHTMLLFWAVMFFAVFINSVTSRTLARFEGVILVVHLFGFFAVLIPLVYFGPHGDGSIFTTFLNGGSWPTQSLSFFVGLPAAVFSLIGADGAVHMSEEIQGASLVVPRALMLSLLINGVLGFAMILALMFCIGDLQAALEAQETLGYPFLEIFLQAVKSKTGATLMASIIIAIGICCVVGAFATSSRMLWSFSRDHGTPGWRILVKSLVDGKVLNLLPIQVKTFDGLQSAADKDLARPAHIDPYQYNCCDDDNINAPISDRSRFFGGIQQYCLAQRCWPLLLLSPHVRLASLEASRR